MLFRILLLFYCFFCLPAFAQEGALYERMARTLIDAPVPKELRGQKEFVQEYKAQLAAFAEALIQSERAALSEAGRPQSGHGHLE